MSKFKPGETSKNVIDKKNEITKSLLRKAELLDSIECYNTIPESLKMIGDRISQDAVHKWQDSELGIISYSRNSAHAVHNDYALKNLLKSIKSANRRLVGSTQHKKNNNINKPSRVSNNTINELRNENDELKTALAEVYRAYMQLIAEHRENAQIDESYRRLVLEQARILGRYRMRTVK